MDPCELRDRIDRRSRSRRRLLSSPHTTSTDQGQRLTAPPRQPKPICQILGSSPFVARIPCPRLRSRVALELCIDESRPCRVLSATVLRMKTGRPPSEDHWPAAHIRSGRRSLPIWATVVILACASVSGAAPEPRQVLLLYSYERDFASHNAFATMFRPELSRSFG